MLLRNSKLNYPPQSTIRSLTEEKSALELSDISKKDKIHSLERQITSLDESKKQLQRENDSLESAHQSAVDGHQRGQR
jgi:hypothetical protein